MNQPMGGSRSRRLVWLLALAGVLAVVVLIDDRPGTEVVPAVGRASTSASGAGRPPADGQRPASGGAAGGGAAEDSIAIAELRPRVPAQGEMGDIFASRNWRRVVEAARAPMPPAVPPRPDPPTLDVTFVGKMYRDGAWEVFLASGGRTLIARQGEVLDGAWRIEAIRPPAMSLVHVGTGDVRELDIGPDR